MRTLFDYVKQLQNIYKYVRTKNTCNFFFVRMLEFYKSFRFSKKKMRKLDQNEGLNRCDF